MRRPVVCALFAGFLLPAACWGQGAANGTGQQSQPPSFRKNISLANVFFTVKDHHGALIPNLTKDSFEIFEDGKPQTIKYFAPETDLPLTLGLLIDSSGSMERVLPTEKVAAADFLRQTITDKDLGFVISFDISVDLLQDLTSDIRLLRAGLERARINVSGGSSGIPGTGRAPIPNSHSKGTLLFDAVYLAAYEILGKQVSRKVMVILTDGVDNGSRLKLRDAMEAAQKADVICYVLLVTDPRNGSNMRDMAELAEQTGGRVISVDRPEKIGDAFRQISSELQSQYSLGYTPDNDKHDGTFRKIEIRTKETDYKVRARKGYYAPAN